MAAIEQGRDASQRHPLQRAFTLLEMTVVIAIITIFAGVIGFGFLRGSANATVGLQSAQSSIASLLTQARSQAVLTGRDAALLVHYDEMDLSDRYLRYLVPVVRDVDNSRWLPLSSGMYLPSGCMVVPNPAPSGDWIEDGTNWNELRSSALSDAGPPIAMESTAEQDWLIVRYTPRGTTTAGNIVVATISHRPPGSPTPFQFVNLANVRGLAITAYGQTRLINNASGF